MTGDAVELLVAPDRAGCRLDRFLVERLSGPTRSTLRHWITDGRVQVDGRTAAKPGLTLHAGMRVRVAPPAPAAHGPRPQRIPVEVVYEDDHLAVVDKPAGLVVHAGHGQPDGTLVNALLGAGMRLASVGGPDRPGIVHRLDQATSGLLMVAKDDETHHALAQALARREIHKRYRALVWGRPDPPDGRIERAIARSRSNPVKMAVHGTRGRPRAAITDYRTIETPPGFALLDVDLLTGRTHQIRVHLQSIHHPIVGDVRYGGRPWHGVQDPLKRKALRELDRLALHACELRFAHPETGGELHLRSELPPAFATLLDVLRRTG